MDDDFYIYEEARNHLIGRRTRRMIRLGDKVEVQVAKVDTFKKQVDFFLAPKPKPAKSFSSSSSSSSSKRPGGNRPRPRSRW